MKTVQERFNEKYEVNQETGCWEWNGYLDKGGYGKMRFDGTQYRAHRLSHILFVGEIPEGMNICHRCDNPKCVNPKCLFLGTQADNIEDMQSKGRRRSAIGERAGGHVLNESDVRLIRLMFLRFPPTRNRFAISSGIQQFLADWFQVHLRTIQDIRSGQAWKHIEVES